MLSFRSKGIKEFIFDRLYKIAEEILPHDREYKELEEKTGEALKKLSADLPREKFREVDRYDCCREDHAVRRDELLYNQGLMDGFIIAGWVDRVRRGRKIEV